MADDFYGHFPFDTDGLESPDPTKATEQAGPVQDDSTPSPIHLFRSIISPIIRTNPIVALPNLPAHSPVAASTSTTMSTTTNTPGATTGATNTTVNQTTETFGNFGTFKFATRRTYAKEVVHQYPPDKQIKVHHKFLANAGNPFDFPMNKDRELATTFNVSSLENTMFRTHRRFDMVGTFQF